MKNPFSRRKNSRWLPYIDWLVVIISIGLFTAAVLPNVVNASAYFDEGYSAFLAQFNVFTMSGYTALDVHPPLYYALLHIWRFIGGDNIVWLRFLSVIFAWVAIVFGFLFVRRGFGRRAGWIAVLMLALSPLFIRYGASMRMYTLAAAIGLSATYTLLVATTSKRRLPWIIYTVLVAAGMWTNYFTALIWVSHLIWLYYERNRQKAGLKHWRWSIAAAVVLYLPWLPVLLFRAGEVQVSGFWIKPISVDTLISTTSMSLVFRTATQTLSWLAVCVVIYIIALFVIGRKVYKKLDTQKQSAFRFLLSLSTLPALLLALASLPPLRPAYVYRYALFAAIASSLLIGVILAYAKFDKNARLKKYGLYALAIVIVASGVFNAVTIGNRNLDTDTQNKLGQVMHDVQSNGPDGPVVVRSPYSYYAARLYQTSQHHTYFLFYDDLAKIGSTKPLYDHHDDSVTDFTKLNAVWLVGEDRGSVVAPRDGKWKTVKTYTEYDDMTKKPAAFAAYYERIQ